MIPDLKASSEIDLQKQCANSVRPLREISALVLRRLSARSEDLSKDSNFLLLRRYHLYIFRLNHLVLKAHHSKMCKTPPQESHQENQTPKR